MKDFQDAGLNRCVGDKCTLDSRENATFFAWRENTGVMPEFKGKIDVVHRDGWTGDTGLPAKTWDWRLSLESCGGEIIKWRPSLEQDDVAPVDDSHKGDSAIKTLESLRYSYSGAELWKPPISKAPDFIKDKLVFTQAMADAGKLPPVGSKAYYATTTEQQSSRPEIRASVWCACTIIAYYNDCVWTSDNVIRRLAVTTFKPIQTERDIAIESMGKVCSMAHGEKELFEALYDAGYRLKED